MAGLRLDKRGNLIVPEANVQDACVYLMELYGWVPVNLTANGIAFLPSGKRVELGSKGRPDYLFVKPGRSVWIEFKASDGGRLSIHQKAWRGWLRKRGFTWLQIKSQEELKAWLGIQQ